MALQPTVHRFTLELSHVDRGRYETLDLRVAFHPSESPAHLIARVLAYACFVDDGLAFSKGGLADPDEPALSIRAPDGAWLAWIDIGLPSAERLHKASKRCPRVVVVTHHPARRLLEVIGGQAIHRREALELYALDPALVEALEPTVQRHTCWQLTFSDEQLYVSSGDQVHAGSWVRLPPL